MAGPGRKQQQPLSSSSSSLALAHPTRARRASRRPARARAPGAPARRRRGCQTATRPPAVLERRRGGREGERPRGQAAGAAFPSQALTPCLVSTTQQQSRPPTRLVGDLQDVRLLDVLQHRRLGRRLVVPEDGPPVDVNHDGRLAALYGIQQAHGDGSARERWAKAAVQAGRRSVGSMSALLQASQRRALASRAAATAARIASAVGPPARPSVPAVSGESRTHAHASGSVAAVGKPACERARACCGQPASALAHPSPGHQRP